MRFVALASITVFLGLHVPAPVLADQAMTFPQMLAHNPNYRATWKAITAGVRPGDKEGGFLRVLNGPATQMNGTRGGGRYLAVGLVCEIHNCDANSVIVVIEPTTSRMYAVQRRRVDVPLRYRFFGRPDKTMQALLVRQAELQDRPQQERLRQ